MISSTERTAAIHATRVVIFILGVISILSKSPVSEACAIISLACWLWQAQLVHWELKLIDKWRNK
jgi:hypothetical protein